jgi:hypothetical protein
VRKHCRQALTQPINSLKLGQRAATARKTQEPLESSAIVGAVANVARLIFSVPLCLLTELGRHRTDLSGSAGQHFSAGHFSGHRFRLIPASGSFAVSAFTAPHHIQHGSLP